RAERNAILRDTAREMKEYFAGRRKVFDVPLAPEGTPFQHRVWKAISSVGYGEVITYSELARRAGHPGAIRAAGAATGRNPITVIVPCHRIVGADGSLTGYAGGLERERAVRAAGRLKSFFGPIDGRAKFLLTRRYRNIASCVQFVGCAEGVKCLQNPSIAPWQSYSSPPLRLWPDATAAAAREASRGR